MTIGSGWPRYVTLRTTLFPLKTVTSAGTFTIQAATNSSSPPTIFSSFSITIASFWIELSSSISSISSGTCFTHIIGVLSCLLTLSWICLVSLLSVLRTFSFTNSPSFSNNFVSNVSFAPSSSDDTRSPGSLYTRCVALRANFLRLRSFLFPLLSASFLLSSSNGLGGMFLLTGKGDRLGLGVDLRGNEDDLEARVGDSTGGGTSFLVFRKELQLGGFSFRFPLVADWIESSGFLAARFNRSSAAQLIDGPFPLTDAVHRISPTSRGCTSCILRILTLSSFSICERRTFRLLYFSSNNYTWIHLWKNKSTHLAPWIFFNVLSIDRPRDLHWFSTLHSSTETGNVSFRCDDWHRSLRELWCQFRCTLVIWTI